MAARSTHRQAYLDSSAELLDDLDVFQVDVGGRCRVGHNLEDGVDGDGGQLGAGTLGHDLRVQRRVRGLTIGHK